MGNEYAILTEDYGIYGKHYAGEVVELKYRFSEVPGEGLKREVLKQDGWTTSIPVRILQPCQKPIDWEEKLQAAWDSRSAQS